jgi:hypothetical protein
MADLYLVLFWDFEGELYHMWRTLFCTVSKALWRLLQPRSFALSLVRVSQFPDFKIDLGDHMLLMARKMGDQMVLTAQRESGPLHLDENYVEINVTASNSMLGFHIRLTESELGSCDTSLKRYFNQMVFNSCVPNIRCKTPTTSFIKSALSARGYLSILLPCNVVQEAESSYNGIHLFNLVVTQLDEIISDIVNGFNKGKELGDERYWSELSASVAIIYFGLLEVQERCKSHIIQPICVS